MKKIYETIRTAVNGNFRAFPNMRRKLVIYSFSLLAFLFAGTRASAATVNVASLAALQSAINSAAAGDIIVLANGTYTDAALTINTDNITIRPATLGGAYLNNAQYIDIDGDYIIFSGFQFTSRAATSGVVITVGGDRNVLTQLNFNGYSAQKYINLQGRYNEVSYCNFKNKPVTAQIGNLIHIDPDFSLPGYNKITHCSFQDMPGAGGDNGNECIRISNGATSTYVSRTIVEYNYFSNTGLGDSEVISVKCRENVLRYNTMTNNLKGNFCFRNGDSNIAYGNFFINSGGIRVKEANNIYCYNNYFENCGDGDITAPVKYVYVSPNLRKINFIHNTIIGGTPIELSSGATDNTWANNIFKNTSGSIFSGSAAGINWAGNQHSGTLGISIPSGMTSVDPKLVRNSDGYYGLSTNSPAIDAASASYPAILDIANMDDDSSLSMDVSGQARPVDAILKDAGCDEFGTNGILNRPLSLSDVGPVYLGGPHIAPSVNLTAPTSGSGLIAPATIVMTAEASSETGTITTVDFYNGANLLGSDTTAPYAYTWTNIAVGWYNLTARATDNIGAVGTSAGVAIEVLTIGTNVVDFSTAGSTNWICPAGVTSVVVECWGGGGAGGSAQRTSGTVAQYGGGGAGGAYARYNLYAVVPGRTYYINVGAGGFNNFIENDVRVPGGDSWFNTNNSPSTTIIAKGGAGGESAIGSTTATGYGLSGAGTAAGSTGDVVYAGGSGAAGALNRAGGGGSSAGTNSAGIAATSNAGATAPAGGGNGGTGPTTNEAAGGAGFAPGGGGSGGMSSGVTLKAGGRGASGKITLTFVPNIVPIVSLTAPANGEGFFAPASIELTANASDVDGVITAVRFYNGSTLLGSDTTAPYAFTWSNVTAGSYSLTARAVDSFGATNISAVATVTVVDVRYLLTVTSGTGTGAYTNKQVVAITADTLSGKAFDRWIGDTSVLSSNTVSTTVTMSTNPATLTATYKNIYTLTVNSGSGSGSYTNGHVQNIVASNAPTALMLFDKWTGDSQYVANIVSPNTTVTIPTNNITLTATYKNISGYYTLTVSNGTGGGTYSDGVQVPITANPPAAGQFFVRWIGDTQYVNNATYTNALVTISANNVNLTATYTNFTYALTVNSGTGGGLYANGARVTITATNVPGKAFDRWIGDTQVVAGVFSLSSIVTMSTNPVVLTATFKDASNGVVNVNWGASGGFYFSADPGTGILGPFGSGKSTIAQLMYSPDNNKDNIISGRAGAVNDMVWDTIPLTENGDGIIEWGSFADSTVRAFTNGYVYALIFQDDNTQPGDWYYSTPLVAITTNAAPQSIEMNTDTLNGDPIDGTNGAQIIKGILLTVNGGTGGGWYTNGQKVAISANTPAAGSTFRAWTGDTQVVNNVTYTNALVTVSTNPITLTAAYYYTLSVDFGSGGGVYTNGAKVAITANAPEAGKTFDQWKGIGAQYVANVYNPNTTVTMPTQAITVRATFKDITYDLTVNSGSGSGSYASGTQVAIAPSDLRAGVTFKEWAGDTQYVNNVTYTNALVTMSTNPATLTAMYYYDLTVNSGSGDGSYTNTQVAAISADTPPTGQTFDRWTGDTQVVNNVTYTNALVTLSTNPVTLSAMYKNLPGWYTLTVNSGDGDGPYTNTQVVAITADAPESGKTFDRWIGDTQVVDSVSSASATVTMPAQAVTLTATYTDAYYTLTVNSGTGDGSFTNGTQVAISADAPASGKVFDQWTGDTQYVDSVSSANATVTMPADAVNLTATYTDIAYTLTVNNGTGGGTYANGAQVVITATAPEGTVFDRWDGDIQAVAGVLSLNTIVTMPASNITLTASCVDVSNGVASVNWGASYGFYFSADPNIGILGPVGSGKSTIAQLMYSPDDIKDDIFTTRAGAVNDMVMDTVVLTETNDVQFSDYAFFTPKSTVRAWTNGYVYALIFQKSDVQAGDWYLFTTPLLALEKKQVEDGPQSIDLNTDPDNGDAIDGPNGAQVIEGVVLTVINGGGSGTYIDGQQVAISANTPANGQTFDRWTGDTQYLDSVHSIVTMPATNITLTATYKNLPGFYTLTVTSGAGDGFYTNGQQVAIAADAPASGQVFYRWTGDTAYVANSNSASTTVTMPAQAVNLTATYKNVFTLTGSAGVNGTVSPTNAIVFAGDSTNFVITANNYYRIATLKTNGTSLAGVTFNNSSTSYSYTWTNVQAAGVLAATFTAQITTNSAASGANVPYSWLAGYGLTNYEEDAVTDSDFDGLLTWQEYIAGTDPIDKDSCLTASQAARNKVTWIPVTGRVYSVYWSTNLVKGFTNLANNIVYPQGSYTNLTPDSRVNHYQIKVRMQ